MVVFVLSGSSVVYFVILVERDGSIDVQGRGWYNEAMTRLCEGCGSGIMFKTRDKVRIAWVKDETIIRKDRPPQQLSPDR